MNEGIAEQLKIPFMMHTTYKVPKHGNDKAIKIKESTT